MGVIAAAIAAVALYVLAFAPADQGVLAWFALAPWCLLARRLKGWRLLAAGYAVGAAILALGCGWIARTHLLNLVLMVAAEAAAFALFGLLLRRILVGRGWPACVGVPLAFTVVEVVRGRFPLDGFPWLSLGYTQHAHPWIVQVASVAGVHGVTFLLAFVSGALADFAMNGSPDAIRVVRRVAGFVLLAAVAGVGTQRLAIATRPEVHVTADDPGFLLIQPNLPQALKDDGASGGEILRRHFDLADRELSRRARDAGGGPAGHDVDLAIWSETMLPAPWPVAGDDGAADPDWLVELRAATREALRQRWFAPYGRPLLAGVLCYEGDWDGSRQDFNAAILFDESLERRAIYAKRVLVPGGEYLPWIDLFPDPAASRLRSRVREMAGFLPNLAPGRWSGVIDLPRHGGTTRLGLTICYEIAYPHLGRELAAAGAQILVNLSNEAWFPDTAEFDQYTAMAVFRAVETGRPLVRVANSGTSGWIDRFGGTHLIERDGRRDGFEAAQVVRVPPASGRTLYVRWGEWLGWLAAGATLLVSTRRRRPVAAVVARD